VAPVSEGVRAPGRGSLTKHHAAGQGLYSLYPDIPLSRRLMRHVVQDPSGSIVWEDRIFENVLQFLDAREVTRFAVHVSDASYIVTMERITQPEDDPEWQK
jgi:hypothetical protein